MRRVENLINSFALQSFSLNGEDYRIAMRMGVSMYPADDDGAETLFKHAGAALHKAKVGRERYLFYAQKMTETVAGRLGLENQLRQALERQEFVLHYQPKVDVATGVVAGAEALLRWYDPRTGIVPPARFIPVLEETGLIFDVGRWVLQQAVQDYLRWIQTGLQPLRIAVNVSPLQLRDRSFVSDLRGVVGADTPVAGALELEITETLIMENVKLSIAALEEVRDMGIGVTIDDFGTGYSSLSHLAKLPIDTLKIDRSFIGDMTEGPQGMALVTTIINLAHSLKLKVVAEGVETAEQMSMLRLLTCDEIQGYLISKPLPVAEFEEKYVRPLRGSAPL
jgi:EAL domain-containing protein (putative c-di-GMP-specific phosphodiesterase class I)